MGKTKIYCAKCQKKCSGEVLRVTDKYFHKSCFQCVTCNKSLAAGGFFAKESNYYCVADYQKMYGTKCAVCQLYVEGEVVSTMGNTYHQKCFTCTKCRQPFESGSKVTNTGKEILCEKCIDGGAPKLKHVTQQHASPTKATAQQQHNETLQKTTSPKDIDPNNCAGCNTELKEGQALIALDRQWHIWCFRCLVCGQVLSGEYMGKDGQPYCEKDYQKSFGVKCAYCERYISGKVLQAGDNHHFHPTCARCSKCGDPFGDGEEMYLQGTAIWHPRCGPGPSENGTIFNGSAAAEVDRISNSASEIQFSLRSRTPSISGSVCSPYSGRKYHRTTSPGLVLREYNQSNYGEDISRIYTYSYLTEEVTGLKKPIDPYDKKPVSPHFHRPNFAVPSSGRPPSRPQSRSRSAMKVLVDSIRAETPRPKSPAMMNEEPIELSHYPGAKKPNPNEKPKIERDDFPAPPYPYTDPERRRRYSDSYKGVQTSDDEDQVDKAANENIEPQLKREEEELKKINSGMSKVILKDIKERQKYKIWKQNNLDPRNASRFPSATKEPHYKMRFESPIGASPSRNLDHSRPFEDEMFDRSISYRGSVGRAIGVGNSYNAINSYRSPKPGSGYKHSTLPASIRNGYSSDFSFGPLVDKTHSTEFSCGKSDISVEESITEGDRRALGADIPASSTYSGAIYNQYGPQSGLVRRSLPNMAHSILVHEPAKIYPYHLLLITNYRLPADVDRCNLERHLSDAEFEAVCGCPRADFYRLPQWRRSEIKRRARLF